MPHFAEDRTLPLVTYVMMLLSVVTGFTAIVALIVALVCKNRAPQNFTSHYDFIARTFWLALAGVLAAFGAFMAAPVYGQLAYLLVSLWVVMRSTVGVMRLTSGNVILNPQTLLLPTHPKYANSNMA